MFKNFKLRRHIKNIKKGLTLREQILFDTLYSSEDGLTSKECKKACGYAMTGWTANKFKEVGIMTSYSAKDKTFKITEIL